MYLKNVFSKSYKMKLFTNLSIFASLFIGYNISAQDLDVGHIASATSDLSVVGSSSLYVSGNLSITSTGIYKNDGTVNIKGNITNDFASMAEGMGSTTLTGTAVQTLAGAQPFKVYDLTIDNTYNTTSAIVLSKPLSVGHALTFTDGIVSTGSNKVIFIAGASTTGPSATSHILGTAEKIGNTAFDFPVGDGVKLRTTTISAPSTATDAFTAEYVRATPTTGTMGSGIHHISSLEYWNIIRTAGTSTPIITLSYDATYSQTGTVADLRVASLIGGIWTDLGMSGSSPALSVIATTAASNFGAFTLASSTALNPLPIKLLSFNATYNIAKNQVDLRWATASEKNSDRFIVERSLNSKDWAEMQQQKAAGNSISILQYEAFDGTPFMGTVYYRLKEIDFDQEFAYSSVQSVTKYKGESNIMITPNPITTTATLGFMVDVACEFQVEISNTLAQIVLHKTLFLQRGENKIELGMEQLVPGNYFIKIYSANTPKIQVQKIIKSN